MRKSRPEAWEGLPLQLATWAAEELGADMDVVMRGSHAPKPCGVRHVVRWILNVHHELSTVDTGKATGTDHASAINSVRRVNASPKLLGLAKSLAVRPMPPGVASTISVVPGAELARREELFRQHVAHWRELCASDVKRSLHGR